MHAPTSDLYCVAGCICSVISFRTVYFLWYPINRLTMVEKLLVKRLQNLYSNGLPNYRQILQNNWCDFTAYLLPFIERLSLRSCVLFSFVSFGIRRGDEPWKCKLLANIKHSPRSKLCGHLYVLNSFLCIFSVFSVRKTRVLYYQVYICSYVAKQTHSRLLYCVA